MHRIENPVTGRSLMRWACAAAENRLNKIVTFRSRLHQSMRKRGASADGY